MTFTPKDLARIERMALDGKFSEPGNHPYAIVSELCDEVRRLTAATESTRMTMVGFIFGMLKDFPVARQQEVLAALDETRRILVAWWEKTNRGRQA